jgi:hypothetical protein
VQQVAAQLPWGHLMLLSDSVKAQNEREWYARATIDHGWSRNVLAHQIDSGLFQRQGGALTNFNRTLPAEQSDLAKQLGVVESLVAETREDVSAMKATLPHLATKAEIHKLGSDINALKTGSFGGLSARQSWLRRLP